MRTNTKQHRIVSVAVVTLLATTWLSPAVSADVIQVPADYPTIQEAINAAAPSGDEIIVAPGTYNEAIDLLGKEVYLHSSDGRDVTTIDATGLDTSVVTCISGETANSIIEGFTITGGTGTPIGDGRCGGGMVIDAGSKTTLIRCLFEQNNAELGGAVFVSKGDLEIIESAFIENVASQDGGGVYSEADNIMIDDCRFVRNTAAEGGGVFNDTSFISAFTDCMFAENTSDVGAGIHNDYSSRPSFVRCSFERNLAQLEGGGAFDADYSKPDYSECTFVDNSASSGGAIFSSTAIETIIACIIKTNTATINSGGGGIRFLRLAPLPLPSVMDTTLCGNMPDQVSGNRWKDLGGNCISDDCIECPTIRLTVHPDPLVAGSPAIFELRDGTPNSYAFLTYSIAGRGSTIIPKLRIAVDLSKPKRVADKILTDDRGFAAHEFVVPLVARPLPIWFQAVQRGEKSNVVETTIEK